MVPWRDSGIYFAADLYERLKMKDRLIVFAIFVTAIFSVAWLSLLLTDNTLVLGIVAGGIAAIFCACVRAVYLHKQNRKWRNGKGR